MLIRSVLIVVFALWQGAAYAAPACSGAPTQGKTSNEPLVDWYDNYIRPYRYLPADKGAQKLTKANVEAFMETLAPFNRRASLDQLELENLVSQIMARYAKVGDFKDIDTATVDKFYRSDAGHKMDFSLFCIGPRSIRTPDDSFG